MRLSVWPNLQQPWSSTLELAQHAADSGWHGLWFADHFIPSPEYPPVLLGLDSSRGAPVSEAWTTLAGLASVVPTIRLGTLVSGNTYRHPAVLAKMAANVDIISGGRAILGLGAGWDENEHNAYGIPFHTLGGRLSRLEEACHVIKSLLSNERTTFDGQYYQLRDAPLAPKPVQDSVPLLVGGQGENRTMRIAAKYADAWNMWGDPETMRRKMAVLDRRCEEINRAPRSLLRTAVTLIAPRDDSAYVQWVRDGSRPIVGHSKGEIQDTLGQYAADGIAELIVPDFGLGAGAGRLEAYDRFFECAEEALR